jgi:hypothetical protein
LEDGCSGGFAAARQTNSWVVVADGTGAGLDAIFSSLLQVEGLLLVDTLRGAARALEAGHQEHNIFWDEAMKYVSEEEIKQQNHLPAAASCNQKTTTLLPPADAQDKLLTLLWDEPREDAFDDLGLDSYLEDWPEEEEEFDGLDIDSYLEDWNEEMEGVFLQHGTTGTSKKLLTRWPSSRNHNASCFTERSLSWWWPI